MEQMWSEAAQQASACGPGWSEAEPGDQDNKKIMAARKAGDSKVVVIGASVARDAGLNPLIYCKPPGSATLHPGPHAVACCGLHKYVML